MKPLSLFFFLAFICVTLVTLGYSVGLKGPFLFDDIPAFSSNDDVIIDPWVYDQWRTAALSGDAGPLKRPLAMVSFAANHALAGGFTPLTVKGVNLLIHLLTGFVLWRFLIYCIPPLLGRAAMPAGASIFAGYITALWLLHPLHVSTVLYGVQRMAQLSTLFVLAGLLVFASYRSRAQMVFRSDEALSAFLWFLLCLCFGALSKENALILPWLVLLLEVLLFKGVWAGSYRPVLYRIALGLLIAPALLLLGLSLAPPELLRAWFEARPFSLEQRLMTEVRVLWLYVQWTLLPNINVMGFQHDDIVVSQGMLKPVTTFLAALAWVFALVVSISVLRRAPWLLFGLAFFLIAHSMESSIFPLELAYEHRNYLPSIGLVLAFGLCFVGLFSVLPRRAALALALVVPVALAVQLGLRSYRWGDDLRLAGSNYFMHEQSPRSAYFYANALIRRYRERGPRQIGDGEAGEYVGAGRHFLEVMHQRDPHDVGALVMLYYFDASVFPTFSGGKDWLSLIEEVLPQKQLTPSDRNGLSVLVECMADGSCGTGEKRALSLIRLVQESHWQLPDGFRLEFSYWLGRGIEADRLLTLASELEAASGYSVLTPQQRIALHVKAGDAGSALFTGLKWLESDTLRRWLTRQKATLG